jgi:uncharacterized protein (DUF2267 family)
MTTRAFYRTVMETSREIDGDLARRATAAVLHALRDRLTIDEADHVAAQLPAELKTVWGQGEMFGREPVKMHVEEFLERVMAEVGLPSTREAQWMTLAVFAALKNQISPGEADDVLAQLPTDLKSLWLEADPARLGSWTGRA